MLLYLLFKDVNIISQKSVENKEILINLYNSHIIGNTNFRKEMEVRGLWQRKTVKRIITKIIAIIQKVIITIMKTNN